MISAAIRYAVRVVLILSAATIALVVLFLVIVGIARYESDEGYCPDAPVGELEAKILAFANEQRLHLNDVEFVGMPRYHADKLGWWGFDLRSREGSYVATIDCDRRVTGFGKIQKLPLEPTESMQ